MPSQPDSIVVAEQTPSRNDRRKFVVCTGTQGYYLTNTFRRCRVPYDGTWDWDLARASSWIAVNDYWRRVWMPLSSLQDALRDEGL